MGVRTSEVVVALGAVVIILSDLIFGLLLGAYFVAEVVWASAAVALVTVALGARLPSGWAQNRRSVLIAASILAGLFSLRTIIGDVQAINRVQQIDVNFLLGMVGLYVGVMVMVYGAYQLWTKEAGA